MVALDCPRKRCSFSTSTMGLKTMISGPFLRSLSMVFKPICQSPKKVYGTATKIAGQVFVFEIMQFYQNNSQKIFLPGIKSLKARTVAGHRFRIENYVCEEPTITDKFEDSSCYTKTSDANRETKSKNLKFCFKISFKSVKPPSTAN